MRVLASLILAALSAFATGVSVTPTITTQQSTQYTFTVTDDTGRANIWYATVFLGQQALYATTPGTCVMQLEPTGPTQTVPGINVYSDVYASWISSYVQGNSNGWGSTANGPHCSTVFNAYSEITNGFTATVTVTFNSTFPVSGSVFGQINGFHGYEWGQTPVSIGSIQMGGPTVTMVNVTRPNNANPLFFLASDQMQIQVVGAPNSNVTVSRKVNGVQQRTFTAGSTDGNGSFVWQPANTQYPHWGMISDVYAVGGVQCQPSPVNFELAPVPNGNLVNLDIPNNSNLFAAGQHWAMIVTGEASATISYSGSVNGSYRNQIPVSSTNSYIDTNGNLTGQTPSYSILMTSTDVGAWNVTFFMQNSSGVQYAIGTYNFTVYSSASQGATMTETPNSSQDTSGDDYTGGQTGVYDPNHPMPAAAPLRRNTGGRAGTISLTLPSGRKVSFKSAAEGMPLETAASSWKPVGIKTAYSYDIDTRGVFIFRFGDNFSYAYQDKAAALPLAVSPKGWRFTGNGFFAGTGAGETEHSTFGFDSAWAPGLVPVFFQSRVALDGLPMNESSADNQAVVGVGGMETNSQMRFVIGPAFPSSMTRAELASLVRHWVNDLRYTLLQPYIDGRPLSSIEPQTDLDRQVLETLQLELSRLK